MRVSWLSQKKVSVPLLIALFLLLWHVTPLGNVANAARTALFAPGKYLYAARSAAESFWLGITRGLSLQERLSELEASCAKERATDLPNGNAAKLEQLGATLGVRIITASVVAANSSSGTHVVYLNRGSSHGVEPGLAVITPLGQLLGKVSAASETASTVLLTTDSSSVIAVTSQHDQTIQAIVRGVLGASMVMDLIPQDASIEKGDTIVTSMLEENTPPGFAVGTVAEVQVAPGQLFKYAALEPLFQLYSIGTVGVIAPAP